LQVGEANSLDPIGLRQGSGDLGCTVGEEDADPKHDDFL